MTDPHALQLWTSSAETVRERVSSGDWMSWLVNLTPFAFDGQSLTLHSSNEFAAQWVTGKFLPLLTEVVSQVAGAPISVVVEAVSRETPSPLSVTPKLGPSTASTRTDEPCLGYEVEVVSQEEFQAELQVAPATQEPALSSSSMTNQSRSTTVGGQSHDQPLKPKYRFDTFVIGEANQLAHAAALSVAESPGSAYNPLYIHGGTGLGKTHLLHAIGHYARETRPATRIAYVSTEHFINRFIEAISRRDHSRERFKQYFRGIDILLMDDVQFLSGKTGSLQEELFHTFNALHEVGKQIVLTSDVEPGLIPQLEDRLKSRFAWGLITDIETPDQETRIAILMKKARLDGLEIPTDVLTRIGERITTNVRELEGAYTRVVASAQLNGRPWTPETVDEALQTLISEQTQPMTVELIQHVVSDHFSIDIEDLVGPRRGRQVTFPRQIAIYLTRTLTGEASTRVGEKFNRDHSTIITSEKKIDELMREDLEVYNLVEQLTKTIRSGNVRVR